MHLDDLTAPPTLPAVFGPIKQVAYIVEDIDAAMAAWQTQLGISPFIIARNISPMHKLSYRGQASGPAHIHAAFAYWGDMQLELIQPVHNIPSIYNEAIERKIKGVHHYAVCVPDFPMSIQWAKDAGYEVIVDSGIDGLGRMSYVEHPDTGIILEIVEWNALTRPYFEKIRTLWENASRAGANAPLDLAKLTPKGALIAALFKYLGLKLTGRIVRTRD